MPLSPKERVLTAFSHQEPDRVPIDYSSNPGIHQRLLDHFGLAPDDNEGLLERLGVDFRRLDVPYAGPPLHEPVPDRNINVWGAHTRWVEHPSGGYWDFCDFPLAGADEETVAHWPMPDPDHFDYDGIEAQLERFSPYAIYHGDAGQADLLNSAGMVRGTGEVLLDLALESPALFRLWDRRIDVQLAVMERVLDRARGRIDFFHMGEDLGTQRGPMISLDMYRAHLRPRHQRFIDLAKAYDLPVMIHSCGSSSWAFEDFIEMGINIVDTLQPEAANMAPAYLKQHYGGRLAFHGCISTAGPLAEGTAEECRQDCRDILQTMMPGGGYAFSPTHQIQDNSPTENVLAMYETARDQGRYGAGVG